MTGTATTATAVDRIWAHSGDSHVMEPLDLWERRLPRSLADRGPRTVREDTREVVYVDGQVVYRVLAAFAEANRAPGCDDPRLRLLDLDGEGVDKQALFPSRGLWLSRMTDAALWLESCRVYNDWLMTEVMSVSDRYVGAALVPQVDTGDAVRELERCARLGFRTVMLSVTPPAGRDYNLELWEPLWDAAEQAGIVLAFHVGTGADPALMRGPGAAVGNYVETFVPGQRTVSHLVASGALDRHPGLRIVIVEGGASWVPALGDRMDEGYRQHGSLARPTLARLPSQIIRDQVFASFQHDVTAVPTYVAMNYPNVVWGDDYPHLEGTYGHTQETLHGLFDGVDPHVRQAILRGNFLRLFGLPDEEVGG